MSLMIVIKVILDGHQILIPTTILMVAKMHLLKMVMMIMMVMMMIMTNVTQIHFEQEQLI